MTARKVIIERPGSYDRLKIHEFSIPKPKSNEILIQCHGCGVNFADCCVRMGIYRPAKVFVGWPITPGFEAAGIIQELGDAVSDFSVGQKVVAMTPFGGYTSHLIAKPCQGIPTP